MSTIKLSCRSRWSVGFVPIAANFILSLTWAWGITGELPPESALPGEEAESRSGSPSLTSTDHLDWPPESALPETATLESSEPVAGFTSAELDADSHPDADTETQTVTPPPLPDESVLPPDLLAQNGAAQPQLSPSDLPVEDEAANSPLRLDQSLDQIPHLRLDLPGHLGRIRDVTFTADGARLCAVGDDKAVVVWTRGENGQWFYERTIRWQVQRGPRGRIDRIVAGPDTLAIGGYGAMGTLGEILLLDPQRGTHKVTLDDDQSGHRTAIRSLAFRASEAEPTQLASMDLHGKLLIWNRNPESGLWNARQLDYDPKMAEELRPWRLFHPIAMVGSRHVVAPLFAGYDEARRCRWHLQQIDVESGQKLPIRVDGEYHYFFVTALAASANGQRFASADDSGQIFLWSVDDRVRRTVLRKSGSAVTSLVLNHDGTRLIWGTHAPPGKSAELKVLDVSNPATPQELLSQTYANDVTSCSLSHDAKTLAVVQENRVLLVSLDQPRANVTQLAAPLQIPRRVAFPKARDSYDVLLASRADASGKPVWDRVFETQRLQLSTANTINPGDWQIEPSASGGWAVKSAVEGQTTVYELVQDGTVRGRLPLRVDMHGAPTALHWLADTQGKPFAVAIGTNGSNQIYIYRLQDKGPFPLLRQFRGHEGAVTSISVSTDRRYLASTSQDGTVRFWKLEDFDTANVVNNRWGADFLVEGEQVVIRNVRSDGPLFFRGVRDGDVLVRLLIPGYVNGERTDSELVKPQDIVNATSQLGDDKTVGFFYRRGQMPVRGFQLLPAWQPMASLFITDDREWAFWDPSGYYDASFEGHQRFGWQVNRGLQQLPDFFLAAQVREQLEKPEIMSRLLQLGSMDAAFRTASVEPPANWSHVLSKQYRLKPSVQIVEPESGDVVVGSVRILARIQVPAGERLVPPKAFANGVVAILEEQRAIAKEDPEFDRYEVTWTAHLPRDQRIQIDVHAATDSTVADRQRVLVSHDLKSERARKPQLYVVAAGINQYRDGRLPRLDFAVNNAQAFVDTVQSGSQSLYRSRAVSLVDQRVTKPVWNVTMQQFATELENSVRPDDLLVIFLSGHGVRDPLAGGYYYVTADADYGNIRSGQLADCLSFENFSVFSKIPCRKLVILDTCHSGAIQPLEQRELKAALRALQEDVFLTLSATEGGQEAVEERTRRFGRFTFRLLEGLRGSADLPSAGVGNGDGQVTLQEVVKYVQQTVAADSARDSHAQFPTAGPDDLLEIADVPLTVATAVQTKATTTKPRP